MKLPYTAVEFTEKGRWRSPRRLTRPSKLVGAQRATDVLVLCPRLEQRPRAGASGCTSGWSTSSPSPGSGRVEGRCAGRLWPALQWADDDAAGGGAASGGSPAPRRLR